MALVICSECSREVSDRAAACPFCGNPEIQIAPETSAPAVVPSTSVPLGVSTKTGGNLDQVRAPDGFKPSGHPRKVGVLLVLGIVCMPYLFVWVLLRKGYSAQARILAFCWLLLIWIWFVNVRPTVDTGQSNSSAPIPQVASPTNLASPKPALVRPNLDSVDYAYTICRIVDSTGQSSEPCEVSSPYINIHAAVGADEAKSICAALANAARKNGAKFENFWRIRVISPFSGGSPLATCSLPQ